MDTIWGNNTKVKLIQWTETIEINRMLNKQTYKRDKTKKVYLNWNKIKVERIWIVWKKKSGFLGIPTFPVGEGKSGMTFALTTYEPLDNFILQEHICIKKKKSCVQQKYDGKKIIFTHMTWTESVPCLPIWLRDQLEMTTELHYTTISIIIRDVLQNNTQLCISKAKK